MAKIDEIKEFIGFLKAIFIATLAIAFLFLKIIKEIKKLKDI